MTCRSQLLLLFPVRSERIGDSPGQSVWRAMLHRLLHLPFRSPCLGYPMPGSPEEARPPGPDGTTVTPGDAPAQARRCLEILRTALDGLGADLSHGIRPRLLLTRMTDWESVGQVHGEFFGEIRPVTTVMQVTRFADPDWLIESEADAYLG